MQNIVGSSASASVLLPAILFIVAIFLAFSTGTSWGTFAILVPIAIAMFPGTDKLEMMIISVSAVLAGAVCGDHVSHYRRGIAELVDCAGQQSCDLTCCADRDEARVCCAREEKRGCVII